MINLRIRAAFAGILAGFITLATATTDAGAAPVHRTAVPSVCKTGYRGMPEYDAKCLRTGTFKDARNLWHGRVAGWEFTATDRRHACKTAGQYGGIRAAVREVFNDAAYDRFRNYGAVLTDAGIVAAYDCRSMGYAVKF